MADKTSKTVIGNTGVGSTPSQTWRGDRADTFIMFGNATNQVRSYNALTAATTLHTPTINANNGACVQGGY
jgi:enoyl-CoA hydratase/carnithine racemase